MRARHLHGLPVARHCSPVGVTTAAPTGWSVDFGRLQEALDKRGITPLSAEHEFICAVPVELPEDQAAEVLGLIDKLEQDEDVQKVFHSLA